MAGLDGLTVVIILLTGFILSLLISAGFAWLLGFRLNEPEYYELKDRLKERKREHNQS